MRILFLILFLFVAHSNSFAQGEFNIWHFGNHAGIDFNSGSPVAITSPFFTEEGVAAISDQNGNLLFSTDGVTLYNSTGAVMDTGLYGDYSSTQSAVIVPFPNNSNKYYVFTSDNEGGTHGICYSVVDMNLNSGSGGLLSLNTPLLNPACEKLVAVKNTNGTDFWVIVHAYPANEFYAYPVTASGVGNPVITTIGSSLAGSFYAIGYLKASPNGQKLAATISNASSDQIELYDFNPGTGLVSNYLPVTVPGSPYGVSFSPDNSKLYVGHYDLSGVNIQQFDLSIANFQNFPFSVMAGTGFYYGALQLAPDGKIYCTKHWENTLGVINNPNSPGAACNYDDNGLTLFPGTYGFYGLPNFIDNYFNQTNCSISLTNNSFNNLKCHDDTNGFINVTVSNGLLPNNYEWNTGATTEDLINLTAGTYSVTVSDAGGCTASDTVVITAPNQVIASLNISADTVFCSVTGGTPSYHYHWSTGATTAFIDSATNGTYSVTVSDINNCTAMASVVISDVPSVNDEGDFSIYPNPASGLVTVVSGQLAPHEIQITDILGRIITDHFHLTTFPSSIDVSNYSEGIYFIKLVSSSGVTVVKKFVVVH